MEKVKVIYVFGSGHSGSTLAGLLLGAHPRIECVGEMKHYEQSIRRDRLCNCGASVFKCDYWNEVHRRAGIDLEDSIPPLNDFGRDDFGKDNSSFLRAILDHAGKDVFCDTSKSKKRIYQYLASPEFEVTVFHLVRDGRAVVSSNLRKSRSFRGYLFRWLKRNIKEQRALFRLGLPPERYHCVRYEDLALRPAVELDAFLTKMGLDFTDELLRQWSKGNHHIGGNHMGRKPDQKIRLDTRYIDELSNAQWAIATFIQFFGLRRFGYPLSRSQTRRMLLPDTVPDADS